MDDFRKQNLKYYTATDLAIKFACPRGKLKRDCKNIARRLARRRLKEKYETYMY